MSFGRVRYPVANAVLENERLPLLTYLFVFSFMALISHCSAQAQNSMTVDIKLYITILEQDSALFTAFNSRDFDTFKSFFSEQLEVYQDNIGVRDYPQSMDAFQSLFTGDYILNRELIRKTLEVYPILDFGAIETGEHRFCHTENGELQCGTFKFVHIWQLNNGAWKLYRIITYNH